MADYIGTVNTADDRPISDSYNAMDSESYGPSKNDLNLSIKDVGMSVPMGISAANVAGIYSKIRMGAGSIEIGFPGLYTGQRNAQTPGMYGEDQRQAIRELANINEIKLTTHAAYNIMGMMGRDQRDNFSLTNAMKDLHEIQRAIDFAADTAGGGSVVVHTGEWDRPLTEIVPDDPTWQKNYAYGDDGRLLFRKRNPELHDANFILLDDRTSQKMETVQKDRRVAVPRWIRVQPGDPRIGHKGKYQENIYVDDGNEDSWMNLYKGKDVTIKEGDYLDYEGNVIINPYNPKYGRVPEFDANTSRFKTDYKRWEDFIGEAKEQTAFNRKIWKEKTGKTPDKDDFWYYKGVVYPDEAFLHATLETNEGHSRGWALQYGERTEDHLKIIEKLKEAKAFYETLMENTPKDEQWRLFKQDQRLSRHVGPEFIPPETNNPVDMIDQMLKEQRVGLEFARQASASQEQQAEDTAETKAHIVTPFKRFKLHIARYYAEAAMRALQRTKDPNDPIYLSIEHIFPERFGGHPAELKYVIDESRKWFTKLLTEKVIPHGVMTAENDTWDKQTKGLSPFYKPGMSKNEADQLAEKYIKATLDTGHLNLWRKFWQPKVGQSIEEADKDFKKWYLNQVEDLAKGGYVGNVHLVDNYGFQDEHLAPGQGNAPIKETLSILKKYGYNKAITTEPGADASTDLSDFHGLMKVWRYLGSPIRGIGSGSTGGGGMGFRPRSWGDVQYSYFGQNNPPYFVFGAYAPSNDWTLWSQVPME
ncbi:MAG TPA: TIM barrel protein [Candidatus Nanoarchaeia archaeon]|nr:TIM barrel protein [Candidatus Nanoarchaeia archaeon]